MKLLTCLLEPILLGYLLVVNLLPAAASANNARLLCLSLAVGIGYGIFSCLFFCWRVLSLPWTALIILQAIAIAGFLSIRLIRDWDVSKSIVMATNPDHGSRNPGKWLWAAFIAVSFLSFAAILIRITFGPYGDNDAWQTWNMHARFLFRGNEVHWADYMRRPEILFHADYPLLLPGAVAGIWTLLGYESFWAPALIAIAFTGATIGLLVSTVKMLSNTSNALLSGIILMGTAGFLYLGSSQYADVPLGFYVLSTLALFMLHDNANNEHPRILLLAGLSAGMAAWTKNEGFLFFLIVLVAHLLVSDLRLNFRKYFGEFKLIAIGSSPVIIILLYFKIHWAPPNELTAQENMGALFEKAIDLSRYLIIMKEFIKVGLSGAQSPDFSPALLGLYLWVSGLRIDSRTRFSYRMGGWVISLMCIAYFLIYLFTPQPLQWHLNTSLSRLFLQLWPSMVFISLVVSKEPARVALESLPFRRFDNPDIRS